MPSEIYAWKNVVWSQVDTDSSGSIDENEVEAAKKKNIVIWKDMDEAAFNREKELNNYILKCSTGTFIFERIYLKDYEDEILKLGKELDKLEEQYQKNISYRNIQEAPSSLAVRTTNYNTQTNNTDSEKNLINKIIKIKHLILSLATRLYGAQVAPDK